MKNEYTRPEYYENRELSWLGFDERILSEARDKSIPLFERLKFLSITASNLDEFFMVRVASLLDMVNAEYKGKDIAGMTAREQLDAIHDRVHEFVNVQYSTWQRSLLPGLRQCGLHVIQDYHDLTEEQARYVDEYFMENVYPVLTPMAVDSSRPFPLIVNKTLNLCALLKKKNEEDAELEFATVQVPAVLPRIIVIPESRKGERSVILLEEMISRNMQKLFLSYDILCVHAYRIMRNADLTIDEDEASDLLKEIEKQLRKRQWGEVIRLEIDEKVDKRLLKILKKEFSVKEDGIYRIGGPLDLTFLMKMYGLEGFNGQKEPKYIPQPVPELTGKSDIFEEIRKGNTLDNELYKGIQQNIINILDQAESVHIMGRGRNMTNLTVALCDLKDAQKETKFENCLADVNIPVGEVFTSPKLKGTNGLLHVTEVYLNGLCYKDLKITFKDGMVDDYECANFPDKEDGRKFIKENLLYNRETLPMGECAIGTNTTAYVMAAKYGIMEKLPILIAEKMGPHIAIGDTCYSYCEDVRVYNPDGKEIVAKENECSAFRKEDPKKAYFNCHTDITIPYEELSRIAAVTAQTVEVPIMNDVAEERVEIPILLDGRFVLEGTLKLNEPFEGK